jgi:hypothetical protein
MAPIAITPPAIEAKSFENAKVLQKPTSVDTSNIGTKRKIICFSGMHLKAPV